MRLNYPGTGGGCTVGTVLEILNVNMTNMKNLGNVLRTTEGLRGEGG